MVQLKRKVTLRTKTAPAADVPAAQPKPEPAAQPNPASASAGSEGGKGNAGKVLAGAAVVLALCGGAYFFTKGGDAKVEGPTGEVAVVATAADTVGASEAVAANADDVPAADADVAEQGATAEEVAASAPSQTVSEQPTVPAVEPAVSAAEPNLPDPAVASSGADASSLPSSIQATANRVIKGDFGNGKVRKQKLGDRYAEVQKLVNQMYRDGLVK